MQIVPRESSILCAVGMLMGDLKHDFVRTFVSPLADADWSKLAPLIDDMRNDGAKLLAEEGIPEDARTFHVKFDCRYLKQFHEVSFTAASEAVAARDSAGIAAAFHSEHNRLYGYSLEEQDVAVEIINVRVQAVGLTEKPAMTAMEKGGSDATVAIKGRRDVYIPETGEFAEVAVYDGHALTHGHRIEGPAMIEEITTAIFVSASFDCMVDPLGSFVLYAKGREDLIKETV